MKKLMFLVLFFVAALSAEYKVEDAIQVGHDIIKASLHNIAERGSQSRGASNHIIPEGIVKSQKEVAASFPDERARVATALWENLAINAGNSDRVVDMCKEIKTAIYYCFEDKIQLCGIQGHCFMSLAEDDFDLLKIYHAVLPIVSRDREAALILLKESMFKSSGMDLNQAIIYDALMSDTTGMLIAALIAGSRYPFGGEGEIEKFVNSQLGVTQATLIEELNKLY